MLGRRCGFNGRCRLVSALRRVGHDGAGIVDMDLRGLGIFHGLGFHRRAIARVIVPPVGGPYVERQLRFAARIKVGIGRAIGHGLPGYSVPFAALISLLGYRDAGWHRRADDKRDGHHRRLQAP